MKTTIWLKSQPKKKLEYPDCYPVIYNVPTKAIWIYNSIAQKSEAYHMLDEVSRIEFRP